jgi:hypothetical protein
MNKFRFTLNALVIAISMFAFASMAQAQASRTWVSGVGDDANPCSRTAPCKTFPGAISKTAENGEINCLDPGGFGTVTITKSITIDCHEVFASSLNAGTNGVNISFDSFNVSGRKTVRLRNINFNGFDSGTTGINITGSAGTTGTKVFIEDCMLDGDFGGNAQGIRDTRSGGGQLNINNTTVRNMGSFGILINPAAGSGSGIIKASISNSRVDNCAFGVGASFGSKTTIFDSVFAGNNVGLHVDNPGTGITEMAVDHCVVSNNTGNGFEATSANSAIRVSNTTAMNNGTLAAASGGGSVSSYGNNQTGGLAFPSTGTSPS